MKRLLLGCLISCLATGGFADTEAVRKYRNFTPQQIVDIPDKVRSSEVPMMYISAAATAVAKGSETLFGMYLNVLMYPGVHAYDGAIRQFQRDLGDEPTGILTVWQIHQLQQRAEMQKLARVFFPNQFSSFISGTVASVRGTFIILDDTIAYPVNHAQVSCYKDEGYCRIDQIYLSFPNDESWSQNYHVMQFDPEYYKVTSWTKTTIDAVPDTSSEACRTTTMNLNFATKEFYQISRNTDRDCEVLGQPLPKLERPRIAQIVDGEQIIAKEFAALQKRAFEALASDFRTKVQELAGETAR